MLPARANTNTLRLRSTGFLREFAACAPCLTLIAATTHGCASFTSPALCCWTTVTSPHTTTTPPALHPTLSLTFTLEILAYHILDFCAGEKFVAHRARAGGDRQPLVHRHHLGHRFIGYGAIAVRVVSVIQ